MKKNKKIKKLFILNVKNYEDKTSYITLVFEDENEFLEAKKVVREVEEKYCKSADLRTFEKMLFDGLESKNLAKYHVCSETLFVL